MTYHLEGDDYLDLWKYFEDRADDIKEAMFNSVTWALGFSAAVFGFIFTQLFDMSGLTLSYLDLKSPIAVVFASLVGLLLCAYSVILVFESKKHILRNWDRATRCKRELYGLGPIFRNQESDAEGGRSGPLHYVWNQVLTVIVFFAAGFYGLLVFALASLRT